MTRVWRPNLSEIPERPGVYSFHSATGSLLYIGKALNLRRRIASYVHQRARQPARLRRLVARARAVTFHETGSELEALLLESRLLKQEAPPFNRLSTRYAALPFVTLTLSEPFPRLLLTRHFRADGALYLGPFPHDEIAEVVLLALQRLFPLRTCEVPIQPGIAPSPCAAFQVRKCAAPCVNLDHAALYQQHIADVLALLAHGREAILQRLLAERQRAAERLMFERAQHVHTLLTAFAAATLGRPLALMPVAQRHMVVLLAGPRPQGPQVFLIRQGRLGGRVTLAGGAQDQERLRMMLTCGHGPGSSGHAESSAAVVDELRIVAGWLHRTRPQARWLPIAPGAHPDEVLAVIMAALPSLGHASLPSTCPQGPDHEEY